MNYTLENMEIEILDILKECEYILQLISEGKQITATVEQINSTIVPEMNLLIDKIKKDEIPKEKKDRWILSCAYITRGWNWDIRKNGTIDVFTKKLGQLICKLDTNYKNSLSL